MNESYFKTFNCSELKEISKQYNLKFTTKKQAIKDLTALKLDKYKKCEQLGNKGKEGIAYLAKTLDGKEYAMKTFKSRKSSKNIEKEVKLQKKAFGIAPDIIESNLDNKYIVMEKMDKHLVKNFNGELNKTQQQQIIKLYKKLDKAGIFHGDSNILNYMYKGKKLYIIDFGMAKEIDSGLIKKLGTSTPNIDIMTLGFILKLKEMNCPKSSYKYLLDYISKDNIIKFKL